MQDPQTLEYIVSVPEANQNGHPIQRIERNFRAAALATDQLREKYPEFDVVLYVVRKYEIKRFAGEKPKPPEPKCPRGCEGKQDGRNIVIRTQKGLVQCGVCGYLGFDNEIQITINKD